MAVVGHTTVTKSKAVAADASATGPTEAINLLIKKCASPEIVEGVLGEEGLAGGVVETRPETSNRLSDPKSPT
jgi:hypothetical protein